MGVVKDLLAECDACRNHQDDVSRRVQHATLLLVLEHSLESVVVTKSWLKSSCDDWRVDKLFLFYVKCFLETNC